MRDTLCLGSDQGVMHPLEEQKIRVKRFVSQAKPTWKFTCRKRRKQLSSLLKCTPLSPWLLLMPLYAACSAKAPCPWCHRSPHVPTWRTGSRSGWNPGHPDIGPWRNRVEQTGRRSSSSNLGRERGSGSMHQTDGSHWISVQPTLWFVRCKPTNLGAQTGWWLKSHLPYNHNCWWHAYVEAFEVDLSQCNLKYPKYVIGVGIRWFQC